MSNDMVLFESDAAGVSTKFLPIAAELGGDLSGGVQGNYAILSLKGGRFNLKYQGNMTPITNDKGEPVGSLELVIIKSNDFLTKQYYKAGYVEGASEAPDCYSLDGKVPAAAVTVPVHTNCMTCPMNTFSKVNEQTGKKTKWCADTRKLAIVPLADLKNEVFGGPMLMRITASALKDLSLFGETLKARGYPYNSVAVRVSMDLTVSYPKPLFKAIRPLTDDEADVILSWYQSDAVAKLLADFDDSKAQAGPVTETVFEQVVAAPPPVVPAAPKAAPVAPKPPPAPPKPPAPTARPVAPPPPPAVKAAPAAPAGVVFGKPAAPKAPAPPVAAPPPPAQAAPEPAVDTTTEVVPGNLEDDIEGILKDLDGLATE